MGRPRLIRGQDGKPGAVVIDAGYNPGNVGAVDFGSAVERTSLITLVAGGVGPMTIATPLEQTVDATARQLGAGRGCDQRIHALYDITSPFLTPYSGSAVVKVLSRPRTAPVTGSMISMRRPPGPSYTYA